MLDNASATQAQIDEAKAALETALATYETAQQAGTKPVPGNNGELQSLVTGVTYVAVSVDGRDVEPTEKWN